PLTMFATFDVGVSEFVDNCDCRLASQDRIYIHLFEECALVVDLPARNLFQLCSELRGGFAAMSLDHADHDVFAATVAPDGFTEHAIGLPSSRCLAYKRLEAAAFFCRCGLFEPLFRSLG